MPFISAKTILNSINILDAQDVKDTKRHPKNEFQAFAYKLSKDLNDDKNLMIYMRLAKNVERSLMERAYSFAIDSNSEQKGRLFLWKLKQLRSDMQKERNKKNYTYEFVTKQMSKFRDELADITIKKATTWQSKELIEEINKYIFDVKVNSPSKSKVSLKLLSVGPNSVELSEISNLKLFSLEISKKIALKLKERNIKEKVIYKDLLKNSYEPQSFDSIIVNSYWQFLPLESELKFLSEAKKILKPSGIIIVNLKESLEDSQEWKALVANNQEKEYFIKNETNHTFRTVAEKCGMTIFKEIMSGSYIVYFLKKDDAEYENSY